MGVSQSKPPIVASAPPTPHPSAARTSSGVAVAPVKSRALGCFPPGRKPVGPAARATRDSSVASSDGGDRSPGRSSADVSQLLADLKDDGLLDALDAVAADIASRKVSLLRPTARHGVVPTPFAPHKTRDGEGVLRRGGSGSSSSQPGRATRRLTWTDARDFAGRLEHVQIFDTADAMAQCAGIAPESARFAPDYSPVRRDDAVPGVPDAVPSFSPGNAFPRLDRSASFDSFVPVVALDDAFRAAARRIATQLLRHEACHGDTSALDATRRCGKMLKRRVTPGVAAAVEGAAAATRVGSENDPSTIAQGVPIDRHVTTAGDALLVWLTEAALGLRRQLDAFEASRRDKKRDIERLLERGDALAASVPSRRVAAALKAVHRDALALIDARARLAAADACVVFLRETVGETVAGSVGRQESRARRRVSADADTSRSRDSSDDSDSDALSRDRRDMAGAFWEVLALGGLLPRETRGR